LYSTAPCFVVELSQRLKIFHCATSPDFGNVWSLVGAHPSTTDPASLLSGVQREAPTETFWVAHKTERLSTHLDEMKEMAATSETVLATVRHLGEVLHQLQTEWKGAYSSFLTFFDKYSKKLNLLGGEVSLKDELLNAVLFGTKNESLHVVLHDFKEVGVRKMEKSYEGAVINMQQLIETHVHPATQILIFELSNLVGFARWYEERPPHFLLLP